MSQFALGYVSAARLQELLDLTAEGNFNTEEQANAALRKGILGKIKAAEGMAISRARLVEGDQFRLAEPGHPLYDEVGMLTVLHSAQGANVNSRFSGDIEIPASTSIDFKNRLIVQGDTGIYYLDVKTGSFYHKFSDIMAIADIEAPANVLLYTPL